MTDVVMLEASLFQLRTAMDSIADETMLPTLELTVSVLANAVAAAARTGVNAARVNDIEFALNDVAGIADSLSANDAAAIAPAIDMLRADVDVLKKETTLSRDVVEAVDAFLEMVVDLVSGDETHRIGGRAGLVEPRQAGIVDVVGAAFDLLDLLAERVDARRFRVD
jgi:hypothetical protein